MYIARVTHIFKDCPKSDGWTGFFAVDTKGQSHTVTGKCPVYLLKNMKIKLETTHSQKEIIQQVDICDDWLLDYLRDHFYRHKKTVSDLYAQAVSAKMSFAMYVVQLSSRDAIIKSIQTEVSGLYSVEMMIRFLSPHTSARLAHQLSAEYGAAIISRMKVSPYGLIEFTDGLVNYPAADKIAHDLSIDLGSELRLSACADYIMERMTTDNGQTCVSNICVDQIKSEINRLTRDGQFSDSDVERSIKNASAVVTHQGESYIYSTVGLNMEVQTANCINYIRNGNRIVTASMSEIMGLINDYNSNHTEFVTDSYQTLATFNALANRFSVITGGPGCGKSTILQCILQVWMHLFENGKPWQKRPVLCAPTGLAVRRMMDATGYDGDAYTVAHILVHADEFDEWRHKGHEKFKDRLVILDEASMLSLKSSARLFSLLRNAHVIVTGDSDQLPSIEYGAVLHDLCAANVTKSVLSTCYRTKNCQTLAENMTRMRQGFGLDDFDWSEPESFSYRVFAYESQAMQNYIVRQYVAEYKKGRPCDQMAVLCPAKVGLCGVENLNLRLQDEINPMVNSTKTIGNITTKGVPVEWYKYRSFRVGDRVILTRNHKKLNLVNGDCGYIISQFVSADKCTCTVDIQFDSDTTKTYQFDNLDMDDLQLAYAMTIHKSEGSEYSKVFVIGQTCASRQDDDMFGTKNLVYTAITRATRSVELIGPEAMFRHCLATPCRVRQSLLTARINGEL